MRLNLMHIRSVFFAFAILSWGAVASASSVEDGAHLFSTQAVSRADREIQEIYNGTDPHKEILVKTVATLPEGTSPEAEAENLFRSRRVGGVLIFIVKQPHKLVVTVGKQTEKRFLSKNDVRQGMLADFKRNDYDAGLSSGLGILRRDLVSAFPVGVARNPRRSTEAAPFDGRNSSREGGSSSWLWILLIVGVGVFFLVRRLFRRRNNYSPQIPANPDGGMGPGGPNYGSGGGGMGRGILGGMLGAIGGSWLYDRFLGSHNDGGGYHNPGSDNTRDVGSVPANDDGDVGSSTSDSWESSSDDGGGSDFGGDSDSGGGGNDW